MVHLNELLEDEYDMVRLKIPVRYILSASIVLIIKLLLSTTLYFSLQIDSVDGFWMNAASVEPLVQNEILIDVGSKATRWTYLFLGWDGAWYASIAAKGYTFSDQSFAFMPGLPLLARLLQTLFGGILPSLAICGLVFGVLWVPLFQSVAEQYSEKNTAFIGSILFALSPYTFLFTTVAYSEGLFLFITLAAWRFYLCKRYFPASIASAVAALVRVPGFLIVLPMMIDLLVSEERGSRLKAALISVPTVLTILGWVVFMGSIGDPLAIFHTTEWSGMYTLSSYFTRVLPTNGFNALTFPVAYLNIHWLLPLAIWSSLLLLPLLLKRVFIIDQSLGIYCLAYLAGVFVSGAAVSIPRLFAVLFPLWLVISKWIEPKRLIRSSFIGIFIVIFLLLWKGFLNGVFVG